MNRARRYSVYLLHFWDVWVSCRMVRGAQYWREDSEQHISYLQRMETGERMACVVCCPVTFFFISLADEMFAPLDTQSVSRVFMGAGVWNIAFARIPRPGEPKILSKNKEGGSCHSWRRTGGCLEFTLETGYSWPDTAQLCPLLARNGSVMYSPNPLRCSTSARINLPKQRTRYCIKCPSVWRVLALFSANLRWIKLCVFTHVSP